MSPQKASSSGSSKRPKRASRRPARPSGGAARTARKSTTKAGSADGLSVVAEQFANRLIKPLDLVMLSRERIQQTLDEAAERGRVTRADANELASELFNLGRQQTETVLTEIERLLGRGRAQLESATKRARDPVERLVRRGAPSDPAVPVETCRSSAICCTVRSAVGVVIAPTSVGSGTVDSDRAPWRDGGPETKVPSAPDFRPERRDGGTEGPGPAPLPRSRHKPHAQNIKEGAP